MEGQGGIRVATTCGGSLAQIHNSVVGERPGGRLPFSLGRHSARHVETCNDRNVESNNEPNNAANVFSNNDSNNFANNAPNNAAFICPCSSRYSALFSCGYTCRRNRVRSRISICRTFLTNNDRYFERHDRALREMQLAKNWVPGIRSKRANDQATSPNHHPNPDDQVSIQHICLDTCIHPGPSRASASSA